MIIIYQDVVSMYIAMSHWEFHGQSIKSSISVTLISWLGLGAHDVNIQISECKEEVILIIHFNFPIIFSDELSPPTNQGIILFTFEMCLLLFRFV